MTSSLDACLPRFEHVTTPTGAIKYVLAHLDYHLDHPHPLNPMNTETAFEKARSAAIALITYGDNVVYIDSVDNHDADSWYNLQLFKAEYFGNPGPNITVPGNFDCGNSARWWSHLHRLLWCFMIRAIKPYPTLVDDARQALFALIREAAARHIVIAYPNLPANQQLRSRVHWLNCQLTIPTIPIDWQEADQRAFQATARQMLKPTTSP